MQMKRYLGVVLVFAGMFLVAGTAAAGGFNGRVDGEFAVDDIECVNNGEEGEEGRALFDVEGTHFGLAGYARGIGTDGDAVEIQYFADLPDSGSASDRTVRINQKSYSGFCVVIVSGNGRSYDGCSGGEVFPEKCSISGMMNVGRNSAKVDLKCSATNLFQSAVDTQGQIDTVVAAFRNNPCGVKIDANEAGRTSSLTISVNGRPEEAE